MFDPYSESDIPSTCELLAEIGIDPHAVQQVIEDDRAMRCPDRDPALPDRTVTILDARTPFDRGLHEAALIEILGLSPAHRPA